MEMHVCACGQCVIHTTLERSYKFTLAAAIATIFLTIITKKNHTISSNAATDKMLVSNSKS